MILLTLDEKKNLFNENNKSFCVLPFLHLFVATNGDVFSCCVFSNLNNFENKLGNINESTIEEILNGEKFKEVRKKMIQSELVRGCEYCYNYENSYSQSPRTSYNSQYNQIFLDEINCYSDGTLEDIRLKYIDIRFSNICNLKCRTCCPGSSSAWVSDAKKMGYSISGPSIIKSLKNDNVFSSLLKYINESVFEIYFAGGEPLITEEHYMLLNHLINTGNTSIKIRYNTNFSILKYKDYNILDLWKNFSNVTLCASLDGMEKRGELIRCGLKWDNVIKNRILLKNECPHVRFILNPTISVMNVLHFPDFYFDWIDKGFLPLREVYANILQVPEFYSIQILPMKFKQKVKDLYYESFCVKDQNKYLYDQIMGFMFQADTTRYLPSFFHNVKQMDLLRNEDFFSIFPELEELKNEL